MKNFKLFSIILSLVLFINTVSLPVSSFASTIEPSDANFKDEPETSDIQIIFENESEKKYKIGANDYIYHELKTIKNGKNVIQVTIYTSDEKSIIDSYDQELNIVNENSIQPLCGPPCGWIAVIAIRTILPSIIKYDLRKSASSATLKSILHAPPSRIQGVLANYTQHEFKAGGINFKVRKSDMEHYLERHHGNYFNILKEKPDVTQSFFVDTMDPRVLNHIATQATQKILQN